MAKETDDLFVKQAEVYKKARPNCPAELFTYLASLTPSHELAWDVGTGNGQAAAAICKHYKKVIATDVAEEQLKYAEQRPNITYTATPTALSEEDLRRIIGPEGSVDLVLIVEALHWFDLDQFYSNVKYVLRKPGGVIAATVYPPKPRVEARVDKVLDDFYATIEHYWAPQVAQYVCTGYKDLPFPFKQELGPPPPFEASVESNLAEFLDYLKSWSAVQTALDKGENPLDERWQKLFADAWGAPQTVRCVKWPLTLLQGTV
jgi:SAM-dependent methyltransferase